jgi:hypothetical protein
MESRLDVESSVRLTFGLPALGEGAMLKFMVADSFRNALNGLSVLAFSRNESVNEAWISC